MKPKKPNTSNEETARITSVYEQCMGYDYELPGTTYDIYDKCTFFKNVM